MDRFFADSLDTPLLTGTEAHHCTHVLRHQVGDRVVVFDGRGNELTARISALRKETVELEPVTRGSTPRPDWRLILVQAVPKAKQMDAILQKAVELGVTEIVPVLSERSVVQLDGERAEAKVEKWRAILIDAAKQSGQNWLPTLHPAVSARDYFARPLVTDLSIIGSLQPGARTFKQILGEFEQEKGRRPGSIAMLIGPEGDFTPAEMNQAFNTGCRPVTLGPIVLRSETAAIFSLSILSYELQG